MAFDRKSDNVALHVPGVHDKEYVQAYENNNSVPEPVLGCAFVNKQLSIVGIVVAN